MKQKKLMKDIGLNDPVTITLPAHHWTGFLSAYASTRWHNTDADAIGHSIIEQVFSPLYLKEREAAVQADHDKHQAEVHRFFTGQPPEMPPHMEGEQS